MQDFITAFLDPNNLAGHISYILLIGSMLMRKMFYLRILAISAGSFSATYYITVGDPVSLFWEILFTLVNLTQLIILAIENRRGRFTAEEEAFVKAVLPTLERAQTRRLLKLGEWTEIADGKVLIVEDTTPSNLIYLVNGSATVERAGRPIGMVGPGDFLGEMSYLTGSAATATVTSVTPLRYLAFDRKSLRAFLEKNDEVRHALEAGFNRNLIDKLVKTNTGIQARRVDEKTASKAEGGAKAAARKPAKGKSAQRKTPVRLKPSRKPA
jgi:CRP-like cAMP-binding protein